MDESFNINKKPKNKNIIVFVAICIIAMFIAGYFIGGSLSSMATSLKIDTQQQVDTSQHDNTNKEIHNITYVYNTTSLAQLYKNVKDSVVVVTGYVEQYSFFGRQYSEVQGSGFVYEYKNDMVVITNKHVVNNAMNITVTFSNGDGYPATVIGSDAYSDLAVLSVETPFSEFHPLHIRWNNDHRYHKSTRENTTRFSRKKFPYRQHHSNKCCDQPREFWRTSLKLRRRGYWNYHGHHTEFKWAWVCSPIQYDTAGNRIAHHDRILQPTPLGRNIRY